MGGGGGLYKVTISDFWGGLYNVTISDTCSYLVTGILLFNTLFLPSEKRIDRCFTSPLKILPLSL